MSERLVFFTDTGTLARSTVGAVSFGRVETRPSFGQEPNATG